MLVSFIFISNLLINNQNLRTMRLNSFSICLLATLIPFFFSCSQLNKKVKIKEITVEKKSDERMTDYAGALEYEFNLVNDPATGTIPEGIRERELAQAREILQQQSLSNNIEANSYSFQGPNNLGVVLVQSLMMCGITVLQTR